MEGGRARRTGRPKAGGKKLAIQNGEKELDQGGMGEGGGGGGGGGMGWGLKESAVPFWNDQQMT